MNGHVKVLPSPPPEKFNTFNTFNTFDRRMKHSTLVHRSGAACLIRLRAPFSTPARPRPVRRARVRVRVFEGSGEGRFRQEGDGSVRYPQAG